MILLRQGLEEASVGTHVLRLLTGLVRLVGPSLSRLGAGLNVLVVVFGRLMMIPMLVVQVVLVELLAFLLLVTVLLLSLPLRLVD